jgi:superfamily II DNA or RNA helicase
MQIFHPGEIVRVRQQRWRIAEVRAYSECQVVALAGIGPLNLGTERSVIAPFDRIEPFDRPFRLRVVGIRRWRRACRTVLSDAGPADRLLTARDAQIDLLPYQLEPAIALVSGRTSRVLIADEVGLGKTVQAGLAVAELRARRAADRVLILTPAGLREQWCNELRDRFSIHAAVVDMREIRRRRATAAVGVNPWSTVPVAVASLDYVRRAEVLAAAGACRWDVVVIDEAHGIGPGTDRHHAAVALCGAAATVILLTATPHSGDRQAFASLCQLGACGDDRPLVFRRTRAEAGLAVRRRIHRLRVRLSAAERLMYARLEQLVRAVSAERLTDGEASLALVTLHKRALSCPWSLCQTVRRRLSLLGEPAGAAARHTAQGVLPLGAEDDDPADQAPVWTSRGLADTDVERRLLSAVEEAARAADRGAGKFGAIARLLDRLRKRSEQAIVFTEYRDTLLHLRSRLKLRCSIIHGGLTRDERRAALADFAAGRCPVLLATDAGGEGLNLHEACRVVINLELPWNPVRLEQRAGRVDRIGQRRTVHVFHLIAQGTAEMRVLERLSSRVARARRDIHVADPLDLVPSFGDEADANGRVESLPHSELAEAAAQELIRLERGRALRASSGRAAAPGSGDAMDLPLLAFTDRARTRACLAGRVLLLVETALEDLCGRKVAASLTPLAVRPVTPVRDLSRESRSLMSHDLERAVRDLLGDHDARFEEQALRLHRAFWESRLGRERAVAARVAEAGDGLLQPGLFDRRAVHGHLTLQHARAEWLADAERRAHEAARSAATTTRAASVVLMLVP